MALTEDQKVCLDCNVCCKYLVMIQGHKDPTVYADTTRFLSNWGCIVLNYDDGVHLETAIPYPCRYLTDKGCRVYEERPEICRKMNKDSNAAFFKRNCKLGDKT